MKIGKVSRKVLSSYRIVDDVDRFLDLLAWVIFSLELITIRNQRNLLHFYVVTIIRGRFRSCVLFC